MIKNFGTLQGYNKWPKCESLYHRGKLQCLVRLIDFRVVIWKFQAYMPKTKYFVLWFDPSLFSLILWFSWKKKSWLRLEIRMGVNLIKDSICRSNSIKDRRKVWKSGVSIVVGIICPLFEIGLTDLPKSGGCQTPQDPTGLLIFIAYSFKLNVLILYIPYFLI